MLKTVEGLPVKNLSTAVIVSPDVAAVAEERLKNGECTCITCLKRAVPNGIFSGE